MAKFKFYNGNQGFYRYNRPNIEEYDVVSADLDGATLIYNGNAGPYDPTQSPYRIKLTFEDAEQYTPLVGPYAGGARFTDGSVTGLRFFDDEGDLLLKVKDLDIDLAWVDAAADRDDLWNFNRAMFREDSKFVGSNDSSGPDNGWDGDDIQTGFGDDKVRAKGGNDFIKDWGGQDNYNGGGGYDTVSYDQAFWDPQMVKHGIRADLGKGKIVGYDGEVDKVKNIESVRGTYEDDKFKGDSENNSFMGYQGRDTMNGKGGFDEVSYRRDADQGGSDGVLVDLKKGTARDGFGHRDKLKSIEGVEGTDEADIFIADKNDNFFRGLDGSDKFVFKSGSFGWNRIDDFSDAEGDLLRIRKADSMADLNIYQDGDAAVVEYGDSTLYLANFDANDLDANDFIFG